MGPLSGEEAIMRSVTVKEGYHRIFRRVLLWALQMICFVYNHCVNEYFLTELMTIALLKCDVRGF